MLSSSTIEQKKLKSFSRINNFKSHIARRLLMKVIKKKQSRGPIIITLII